MIGLLCAAVLLGAPSDELESYEGKVRVTRGVKPLVTVKHDGGVVRIGGEFREELQALQSFTVNVTGRRDGETLDVREYAILDIGGGNKPIVGTLVEVTEGGFALKDGDGDPIALALSAGSKRRLTGKGGSKIWVFGKMLPSGQVRVRRYGVLREPAVQEEDASPEGVKR